jgi:ParB family chromosome partitioning protein
MGHARSLISVEDPKSQLKIFNKIIDQELSVRKVEEMVRKLTDESKIEPAGDDKPPRDYEALKDHLKSYFNSNIKFQRNTNGSGKIVIPFSTDEDLERIIAIFDKMNT